MVGFMNDINIEKLMQSQFDLAKFWLTLATSCGVAILVVSIVVIVFIQLSTVLAFVAAILVAMNAVFQWRSGI